MTLQHPNTEPEGIRLRNEAAYPWFPELDFKQSACPGGGEPGVPIDRPVPELAPGGDRAGLVPKRGRLIGGRT
jgi:hypothetical protein